VRTLFDPPSQAHSGPSVEAAEAIKPDANRLRQVVYDAISRADDGLTDEEIQDQLKMIGNTARPRRRELQLSGLIVDSGRTRRCKSGRKAVVWVVNPRGLSND
jgi:hypothetical protein